VIAPQIEVSEVGPITAREQPDVAFVGLGASSQHALELIEQIVHEAACPVVALLHEPDPDFVMEAAKRGIFACEAARTCSHGIPPVPSLDTENAVLAGRSSPVPPMRKRSA